MKKVSIIVVLILGFIIMCQAKEKKIDQYITVKIDGNPCRFHVTGTVTYTVIPPEITGYHVTLTGTGKEKTPCGQVLQFDGTVNITYNNGGTIGTKFEIIEGKLLRDGEEIDLKQTPPEIYEAFAIIQEIYLQEEE